MLQILGITQICSLYSRYTSVEYIVIDRLAEAYECKVFAREELLENDPHMRKLFGCRQKNVQRSREIIHSITQTMHSNIHRIKLHQHLFAFISFVVHYMSE